jgi:homoserine dehydrogenase
MKKYNLALLGFGNVGRALARLLLRKRETLKADHAITFSITGIATGSKGRAVDPGGLDIERALALIEAGESIDGLSRTLRRSLPRAEPRGSGQACARPRSSSVSDRTL